MEGQFHKKLGFIKDDDDKVIGVAVSGPINWSPRETGATISVSVTQDGGGTARGATAGPVSSAKHVWALAALVEGDGALEAGVASLEASANVSFEDGTSKPMSWTSPPHPPEVTLG